MPASSIGLWARRIRFLGMSADTQGASVLQRLTKQHLIETEIEDRIYSRCGRPMRQDPQRPFEFSVEPDDACAQCKAKAA